MLKAKALTALLRDSAILHPDRELAFVVTADTGSIIAHSAFSEEQRLQCKMVAAVSTQIWSCYSQQQGLISHTRQQILTQQQMSRKNLDDQQLALIPQLAGPIAEETEIVLIDCDYGKVCITKLGQLGKLLLCIFTVDGTKKGDSAQEAEMMDDKKQNVGNGGNDLCASSADLSGILRAKVSALSELLTKPLETLFL